MFLSDGKGALGLRHGVEIIPAGMLSTDLDLTRKPLDNYSWTEHISRKIGLWQRSPKSIVAAFERCGFHIPGSSDLSSTDED